MATGYKMPWDEWQPDFTPAQQPQQQNNSLGHGLMSFVGGIAGGAVNAAKSVVEHPIQSAEKAPGAVYDNLVKPSVEAFKNLPSDVSGLAHGMYHAGAGVLAGNNIPEAVKQLKLADDAFSHTFLGQSLHPLIQQGIDHPTGHDNVLGSDATKQSLLHAAGKTGEEVLNLTAPLTGGKLKESIGKGALKEAAKDGLITGGKFGAAYGASSGLQDDKVTWKGLGEHIAEGTLAGSVLGGTLGAVAGTHASINEALDHQITQFDHLHVAATMGAFHGAEDTAAHTGEHLALPQGEINHGLPATSSANPVKQTPGGAVFGMHEITPETQKEINHFGQIIHAYKAEGPRVDDLQSVAKVQMLRNQASAVMENLAADRYQQFSGEQSGRVGEARTLMGNIRSAGGIKTDPGIKEEMAGVPLHIRRNAGFMPDDMAGILKDYGHNHEDGGHLLSDIQSAHETIRSQKSDDHLIERAHSTLATGFDEAAQRYQQAAKIGALTDAKYKELMAAHKLTDIYHPQVSAEDAKVAEAGKAQAEAKAGSERIDGAQSSTTPVPTAAHENPHELLSELDRIDAGKSVVGKVNILNQLIEHPDVGHDAKQHFIRERAELLPSAKKEVDAAVAKHYEAKAPQDVVTSQGGGAGEKPPAKAAAAGKEEPVSHDTKNDPTTDKAGVVDKALRSAQGLIKKQGEGGKKLADLLQKQDDTHEMQLAHWINQMKTFQKLKGKDVERFWDIAEGKGKTLTGSKKVMKAVEEWRAVRPQVLEAAKKAGLDVKDLGETYLPHSHAEYLSKKKNFNAAVEHLVKTGQVKNEAEAIRALRSYRDETHNRRFGNLEESRRYNLPGYDKSKTALLDYMENASRRITQVEAFGKNDEKAFKLLADIKAEGKDAEAAHNAFNVSVGAKKYNQVAANVSGKVRGAMAVTKLGRAAISNATQVGNAGVVTGNIRTAKNFIKYWTGANKLNKDAQDLLHESGVISDSIISHIKEQYGFGKITSKVASPAFNTVEKGNRAISFHAGVDWANSLARRGKTDILRDKLGIEGDIGKNLTSAQKMQAGRKVVELTQFKVKPKDLPGWADSPQGKVATQFKSFSYKQTNFVKDEVLKPLAKGNVVPLARLMALLPIGYGAYEVKRMASGTNTSKDSQDSPEAKVMNAWNAMGGGGLVSDIPTQLASAATSKTDASKKTIEAAAGIVGGPATSEATKLVDNTVQAVGGNAKPIEKQALGEIPVVGPAVANAAIPFTSDSKSFAGGQDIKDLGGNKLRYMQDLKVAGDSTYDKFFGDHPELDPTSKGFQGFSSVFAKSGSGGGGSSSGGSSKKSALEFSAPTPKKPRAGGGHISIKGKRAGTKLGKVGKSQVTNHLTRRKASKKRAV